MIESAILLRGYFRAKPRAGRPYAVRVLLLSRILLASLGLLLGFPKICSADRLVLISPHWEGIKYEFEKAFAAHYLSETGRNVELDWIDAGGTSETLRFIRSEFKSKPAGIGIDVFFGGGVDPFIALKEDGLLQAYRLPQALLDKIPPQLGGIPLYDEEHTWYGATLAGFGIIYNKVVLGLVHLPVMRTWEELASPQAFGWVGSADPRKSGSVHMVYEIILQAYGWEKGWRIITGLGANVRNFTNSASQVPKDIAIGEVAYGLAIDTYAWAQVKEVGEDKIGYIMPENLTVINPDSIGILKGAPNRRVAEAFIRFVMSTAGQKLWLMTVGTPEGPQRFQLNRFSVIPSVYRVEPQQLAVKIDPFAWKSRLTFDAKLSSDRWGIVNDLVGVLVIDQKELLNRAWKKALADGLSDQEWERLGAMPVSAEQALELAQTKWRDPAVRNHKLNEWGHFARSKYQQGLEAPVIRKDWLSLGTLAFIALGLVLYTRKPHI